VQQDADSLTAETYFVNSADGLHVPPKAVGFDSYTRCLVRSRMATRTIRSLILTGYALGVHCQCGRYTNLSTSDLRALPVPLSLPARDLIARLTCKKCRRRGMAEARTHSEHQPFSPGFNTRPITAPQLMAR